MMRGANYAKRDMPLEIWNHNHHHVNQDFLGLMAQSQPSVSTYPNQNLVEKTCHQNEENIMRGTNIARREDWNHHVHQGFLGFMNQPKSSISAYPTQNLDECVEVVAVHRKGNSSLGSGRVFMEYDFFHEKDGKVNTTTTLAKDLFPTATNSLGFGSCEASSSITAASYGDTSIGYDSIDLSLRL
ncbi:hypothetical protein TSUD_100910 [Trifolium subterraneum]|uniref:Uncharacterized protein n=1 Tax=Trifolium subterraneum TaxID=3900 RepID=A0A2Z6PCT6_TRISU|nr:hypothetical protein TSUD_100910 [Trifolium subterraneum]